MLTFDSPRISGFILRFSDRVHVSRACVMLWAYYPIQPLCSPPSTNIGFGWKEVKYNFFTNSVNVLLYLINTLDREWRNLTGVILGHHRFRDDCFQGLHPLFLISLLLTHEDELPIRSLHNYPTLPFVASCPFRDTLSHWIPMILWANKNNSKFNGIL